ncbi:hypothetical protein Tco_0497826 [Tanacetum coccineum]
MDGERASSRVTARSGDVSRLGEHMRVSGGIYPTDERQERRSAESTGGSRREGTKRGRCIVKEAQERRGSGHVSARLTSECVCASISLIQGGNRASISGGIGWDNRWDRSSADGGGWGGGAELGVGRERSRWRCGLRDVSGQCVDAQVSMIRVSEGGVAFCFTLYLINCFFFISSTPLIALDTEDFEVTLSRREELDPAAKSRLDCSQYRCRFVGRSIEEPGEGTILQLRQEW